MNLRQVPTVGSQLFPNIWHCINPQHINSLIGQIQEIIHHLIKHYRIAVIQIPLIRIKTGHYKFLPLRKIGKVSWRCSRKYLGHGLLIHSRHRIIVKEEIPVLIFLFTCSGTFCPLMVF